MNHIGKKSTVSALAALYLLHRLGRRSGFTPGEAADALPGDEIVPQPMWQSTRAITSTRRPREERSSDRIVPELQHVVVGDRIPDSNDWSVFFTVEAVEPPHALVLHSTRHVIKPIRAIDFSWAFAVREIVPGRSRFLIRARTRYTPRWAAPFVELVVGPADFVNAGAMLRGIKKRAETTTATPDGEPVMNADAAPRSRV